MFDSERSVRLLDITTALTSCNRCSASQRETSKSQLPSFWVPSLTPSTANDSRELKPAKLNPICPASSPTNKHSYSLKALVTVNFTEEKDDKDGGTVRIC